jgi:hypothetical protein
MRSLLRHGPVERERLAFVVVRMVPLLFDAPFPIIHVSRFGLDVIDLRPIQLFNNTGLCEQALIIHRAA